MLHHLADELPDNATWGDVAYQVELKASIEQGLKEADAGHGGHCGDADRGAEDY
ncbi:MAG: hypothetical protein GY820_42735 [Gammaproteobacteria bacterium]|nr:hypothetical protein [Gammaproteobacteria bacterium]